MKTMKKAIGMGLLIIYPAFVITIVILSIL
jgi:hypothetical protein